MLYITTRSNRDAFTTARTLSQSVASDGGLYVPFSLPTYSSQEIQNLAEKSFGEIIADILNLFFAAHLTGWDVDFAIGKNTAKLIDMKYKMVFAELWHNPGSGYNYIVSNLYDIILQKQPSLEKPTEWVQVAVRIAVIFGLFGDLIRLGQTTSERRMDIAVSGDDFSLPMAAWYARKMGLPIGSIICGCNVNSSLWDLLRRGEYSPAAAQYNLSHERLIQATLGCQEAVRYQICCEKGRAYSVDEASLRVINEGLDVAVVGNERIDSVITSVFNTKGYRLCDTAALAYAALQDYRATITEGRAALILADYKPAE